MKRTTLFSVSLLLGSLSTMSQVFVPKEEVNGKEETVLKQYSPSYWYVGSELFAPIVFDDLSSWSKEPYRFHLGKGLGLKGGYQFSSVFGLELQIGWGKAKMTPNGFQNAYWLGRRDSYTYYPYTLIDGTIYHYPFVEKEGGLLVGEQGKNIKNVQLEGTSFAHLYSKTSFWQASLNGSFNLTRLFYTDRYTERPVELFVRPGIYISRFASKVYDERNDHVVAPSVNRDLTLGLGGDLSFRFNLSSHWSIDVTNTFVWERDHAIDGVLSAKRAYDTYVWQPALGLVYKFRKPTTTALAFATTPPRTLLPSISPSNTPVLGALDYWYPDPVATAVPKQRSHSASIYLTYPLNQTHIVRQLHKNAQELARVDREIQLITSNPDYSVRSIKVEGFASPEGPHANNMRLGEGRAASIIDYILEQDKSGKLNRSMFAVVRMTENWRGLRDTLLSNVKLPARDAVLELLAHEQNTEVVKQKIKQIPGYSQLLTQVYPYLRKSTYTVNYDVRDYGVSDARNLLQTNPSALSPEEIYAVAVNCGIDTPEGKQALALLLELHPQSDMARSVRGVQKLLEGQYEKAVQELEAVQSPQATVTNTLGVAYAYLGHWEQARKLFSRVSFTCPKARHNLITLTRHLSK